MFESERTVEILSEIWILWRERSQKQKKAGPAYRCVSESRHIFCNVYIQEKIIKIIQNIRRKKGNLEVRLSLTKDIKEMRSIKMIYRNSSLTNMNKKVSQKIFTKMRLAKVIHRNDSQKWFTEMIHKNDSQKWLTKMICKIIHKNQSYKKDSRKIIQKRFTNMRLTKMIHRDDTNIKETQ